MTAAPRYATPRRLEAPTFGGKVDTLARAMGMPLMPWQRQVADVALELDEHGRYRYSTIVITVPRQSGKTSLMRPIMAHRALTVRKGRIWITAQLRQDARDTWQDTCELIEESPLGAMTKRRNTNGSETLTFSGTSSTIRLFNAGSDKALHGKQSDLVFIDEAFAFSMLQGKAIMQAVVPTQATRPGAQTYIVSTAGTAASEWLREWVDRGRAADGRRLAYFEWSIPEDTEDLDDLDVYARHHPALGHTIGPDALETAYEQLGASEFARAYGNFWTSSQEWAIAPAVWKGAQTEDRIDPGAPVAFGIEVHADRSGAVIVACGPGVDSAGERTGRMVLEIVDTRGGIGWVASRALELAQRHPGSTLVVDPVSPAGPVHRELQEQRRRRHRVPLAEFDTAEFVTAHTEFLDALTTQRLGHPGVERLDQALAATETRPLRETTVFSRRVSEDGTSPAPLIASVLAHHGVLHPNPVQAPRIAVAS